MSINLKKGEGVNLSKNFGHVAKFKIEADWDAKPGKRVEINIGAFILHNVGGKSQAIRDENFVFYNNRTDPTGSVLKEKDNWQNGTDIMHYFADQHAGLKTGAVEVSVITEIYEAAERNQDFGHVDHCRVTVSDEDTGQVICNFKLTEDDSDSTAVQMGSFVIKEGDLHFEAVGKGYRKGWESFVRVYGLDVGQAE